MIKMNFYISILMLIFFQSAWAQKQLGKDFNKSEVSLQSEKKTADIEHATQNDIDTAHPGCGNHNIPKEYQHHDSQSDIEDYLRFVRNNERTLTTRNAACIEIPVNIVVIKRANDSDNDLDARFYSEMTKVNQICQTSNISIRFKLTRIHKFSEVDFAQMNQTDKYGELRNRYTDYPRVLPLLVTHFDGGGGFAAVQWMTVVDRQAPATTWLHEMGHFLGLHHTHDGGMEVVNGSNCNTAGDYVCDTPAEPANHNGSYELGINHSVNPNCEYIGTFRDANGELYRPDVYNVMGYSPCGGRRLTRGQETRMIYFLQTKYPQIVPSTNCDGGGGGGSSTLECEANVNNGGWQILGSCAVTVPAGQRIELAVNPNGLSSYQWSGPNGFSRAGDANGNILIADAITSSQAGNYTVTVNNNGTTSTKTIQVTVTGGGGSTLECEANVNNGGWQILGNCAVTIPAGQRLQLAVNPNGLSSYQWSGPNGFSRAGDADGNILIADAITSSQAGNYTVTVNNNGTTSTKTIQVTVTGGGGGTGGGCYVTFTNTGCQTANLLLNDNNGVQIGSYGSIAPNATAQAPVSASTPSGYVFVMKVGTTTVGTYTPNCSNPSYSFDSGGCSGGGGTGSCTFTFTNTGCQTANLFLNDNNGVTYSFGSIAPNATGQATNVMSLLPSGSVYVMKVGTTTVGTYTPNCSNPSYSFDSGGCSGGGGTGGSCTFTFTNTGCQAANLLMNDNNGVTMHSFGSIAPNATGQATTVMSLLPSGYVFVMKVGTTTVGTYTPNCSNPSYSFDSGGCSGGGGTGGSCTFTFTNTGCQTANLLMNDNNGVTMYSFGSIAPNATGQATTVMSLLPSGYVFVMKVGTTTVGTYTPNCSNPSYSFDSGGCDPCAASPVVATVSGNLAICAGQTTALTASGGTTYQWSNGATTPSVTVGAGTYSVTATNASGCKGVKSVTVKQDNITANISGNTTVCSGQTTTLTASGGTTYKWSNGSTTASITVGIGTYTVTATNARGCTSTKSVTVTQADNITASISGSTTVCSGRTTTLTASGGTTYKWSNGITTASTTVGIGTYTVTATNASGCTDVKSVIVTQSGNPTASISGSTTVCSGQTTTLTASGGASYKWSNGTTNASITVGVGTYTVTATNVSGCTGTKTVSVTQSGNPTASISSSTTVCSGQTTTLTASGGASYRWSNDSTNARITVGAGTYTVTATNASGCTGTKTVTVTSRSVIATISGTTSVCSGGTTRLTASGGSSYRWSNGATTSAITVGAGTYTVTVTSGSCSATRSVTVTSGSLSATISGNTSVCNGGTTTLTASGGSSYRWSNGATTSSITVGAGTYTVTVTSGSCTATKTVSVTSVAPSLTFTNCPNNITVTAAQGTTCAPASWLAPTATSTCGTPSVSSNYNPDHCFPMGTTTVSYTSTLNGQTKTCSFTVTVNQPQPQLASIGDLVFADNNNNGVFDGSDTPLSNVTVTLCNSNGQTITTAITNTSGLYSFTALAAGTYVVKFPASLLDGKAITTTNPFRVNLTAGQNFVNADAGFYKSVVPTCPDGTPKKAPGTACNDNNPNTTNDVIQADGCGCAGTPSGGSDFCTNPQANVVGNGTTITISGITTSAAIIQVFNSSWTSVYNQQISSSSVVIPNLPAGSYQVKVSVLGAGGSWPMVCEKMVPTTVSGGASTTCSDGTPKKTPGTACNDNNPNTTNDVIQADGCGCAGAVVVPTCPDGSPKKTPGTACNDNNPNTTNDVIQADGCGCAGTPSGGSDFCTNPQANVVGNGTTITISGIATSAAIIQVFNSSWTSVHTQQISSSSVVIPNLPAGTYQVKVSILGVGGSWPMVCEKMVPTTVSGGLNLVNNNSTILELTARPDLHRVQLGFVNNTGDKTDFFEVEKLSNTSGNFERLAVVNSTYSSKLEYYTTYDADPTEGDNYYRIKATLYNGNEVFSTTQKVNFKNIGDVSVFPNPASDYVDIDLKSYEGKSVTIYMYSQLGKLILTKQVESASNTPTKISLDEKLCGQYLIRIASQGRRDVVKQIILVK